MKKFALLCSVIFSVILSPKILLANSYVVSSTADNGPGTLRQALNDAAGATGPHTITFSLSAGSVITINNDLQINGGNQNGIIINGFVDAIPGPDIIIKGSGTRNTNLVINGANGVKIYGLIFDNMENGIRTNSATNCEIKGCYFGSDHSGAAIGSGIQHAGVWINNGRDNIVGGSGLIIGGGVDNLESCLFVGCMRVLNIDGDPVRYGAVLIEGSSSNQVVNSFFGTDITGIQKLGNGIETTQNIGGVNVVVKMPLDHHNILVRNNSPDNIIANNVICGATGCGIYVENGPSRIVIKGNKVGVNANGIASIPNEACGIYMENISDAIVGYNGGDPAAERNTISGNGGAVHNNYDDACHFGWNDNNQFGIYCKNITNCSFKGNYIGTDLTGNSSGVSNILGNRAGGIKIVAQESGGSSTGNHIGGANQNEGNVISGNGYIWGVITNSKKCGGAQASNITGGPGIIFQYANCSDNIVEGNNIGIGADGTTPLGNKQEGVSILGASNNTIGGNTSGAANYICNNLWGVMMQIDFGCYWNGSTCVNTSTKAAKGNIIIGNSIGLDRSGNANGNGNRVGDSEGGGVGLQMGSNGNYIGKNNPGEGNIISGNRAGIVFRDADNGTYGKGAAKNNFVYNNIIGLNSAGSAAISNNLTPTQTIYGHGIVMQVGTIGTTFPSGNIIGGTGTDMRNIISGNQQAGILLHHTAAITVTTANSIVGNYIGTDINGTSGIGNSNGIEIVNVNKTIITSNNISGNTINGVLLNKSGNNTLQTNIIGVASDGTTVLGNGVDGIHIQNGSKSNIIGGPIAGQSNLIANNTGNGINILDALSNLNSITHNSFSCNALRGIELNSVGNDNYQAPSISSNSTSTQIIGKGPANSYIEIFSTDACTPTCDAAAGGTSKLQGKTFVAAVISDASGNWTYDGTGLDYTQLTATASQRTTAPATALAYNTSEFSTCFVGCKSPTTVSIAGQTSTTICSGEAFPVLTATASDGDFPYIYKWYKVKTPTDSLASTQTVTIGTLTNDFTPTSAGTYRVEVVSPVLTCSTKSSNSVPVIVNPLPVVNLTSGSAAICLGNSVLLTAAGSGASEPYSYSWTTNPTGQDSPGTDASKSVKPTETTKYIVTVTSKGCSKKDSVTVTVNPLPNADITVSGPTEFCQKDSVKLSVIDVAGQKYQWLNDAGNISGATSSSYIAKTSGNYKVTVTSALGCPKTSDNAVSIIVNDPPVLTLNHPSPGCIGVTVVLNAQGTGDFTWFKNGADQNNSTNTLSTLSEGKYVVVLTNPNTGCFSKDSTNVSFLGSNFAKVITHDADKAFCAGDSLKLSADASPSVGIAFQWFDANGKIAGAINADYYAKEAGSYSVSIELADGCKDTSAAIDIIMDLNPTVDASASDDEVCEGTTITLNAVASGGSNTFVQYNWKYGASTKTGASFTDKPTGNTDYIVEVTDSKGCTSDADTVKVIVNPRPTANASAADAEICVGKSTTLSANATGGTGVFTYTWVPNDGSLVPIANASPIASPSVTTEYKVVVKDAKDCLSDSSAVTVTVNKLPLVTVSANDSTICKGTSVTITANVTGGATPYSYTWNNGKGNVSSFSDTPADDATYSVVVTDKNNCESTSDDVSVVVNDNPIDSDIDANGPTTFCEGGSVKLTVQTVDTNPNVVYNWYKDGATTAIATDVIEFTANASGNYTVTATFSDTKCFTNLSDDVTVSVKDNPGSFSISPADTAICQGRTVVLQANPSVASTYRWILVGTPDDTVSTSASYETGVGGIYRAIAFIDYGSDVVCESTSSDSLNLTINPNPTVTITTDNTGDIICSGKPAVLYANPLPANVDYDFIWTPANANNDTITVNVSQSDYSVTVVDKVTGCSGSDNISFDIKVAYVALANDTLDICLHSIELLDDSVFSSSNDYTLTWTVSNTPPAFTSYDQVANHPEDLNITGVAVGKEQYKLVLKDNVFGCESSDSVMVKVFGLPVVNLTSSLDTICVGTPITFAATATDGTPNRGAGKSPYDFYWGTASQDMALNNDFRAIDVPTDKQSITDAPAYVPVSIYKVMVSDSIGCTAFDTISVHPTPKQDLNIPNLITPNGDAKNDVLFITDKASGHEIFSGAKIQVYNRWGQAVYRSNNYDNKWNAEKISDGVYYYHLEAGCGEGDEYKGWLQIISNENN